VDDYNLYAKTGITTRAGADVAGLGAYSVFVATNTATIGTVTMKAISVTVRDPQGNSYPFTAYKAGY
jgi:hypothetical protein